MNKTVLKHESELKVISSKNASNEMLLEYYKIWKKLITVNPDFSDGNNDYIQELQKRGLTKGN